VDQHQRRWRISIQRLTVSNKAQRNHYQICLGMRAGFEQAMGESDAPIQESPGRFEVVGAVY
jgi:hypothetical protein